MHPTEPCKYPQDEPMLPKHAHAHFAILGLQNILDELNELYCKISGQANPVVNSAQIAPEKQEIPTIVQVLEEIPDDLQNFKDNATDLIYKIESALFNP